MDDNFSIWDNSLLTRLQPTIINTRTTAVYSRQTLGTHHARSLAQSIILVKKQGFQRFLSRPPGAADTPLVNPRRAATTTAGPPSLTGTPRSS